MSNWLARQVLSLVGSILFLTGVLVVVGTIGFFAYGRYEQAALTTQARALTSKLASETSPRVASMPNAPPPPVIGSIAPPPRGPATIQDAASPAKATATPAPVSARSTAPSSAASNRPVRIAAPSIGLDAGVVEAPIENGEWVIPKFEVGHLAGTADPNSGGNVVLAGHVESITSGDVFANLAGLAPGKTIRLYTRGGEITYVVRRVETVKSNDMAVLAPTRHETLTLITCTGTWMPLQNSYSDRIVVIGDRRS
jgi:LPXTG-site transpeptidase (sortase) family protein